MFEPLRSEIIALIEQDESRGMSVRSIPKREVEAPAESERDGSELPEGWASSRFDSIAELTPRHPGGRDDAQLVTFVPMKCDSESSPDFDRSIERSC